MYHHNSHCWPYSASTIFKYHISLYFIKYYFLWISPSFFLVPLKYEFGSLEFFSWGFICFLTEKTCLSSHVCLLSLSTQIRNGGDGRERLTHSEEVNRKDPGNFLSNIKIELVKLKVSPKVEKGREARREKIIFLMEGLAEDSRSSKHCLTVSWAHKRFTILATHHNHLGSV